MKYSLSNHASRRFDQRSISINALHLLEEFGVLEKAPGDAKKLFLRKKENSKLVADLKRLIHMVEKTEGLTLIISNDNVILTGYFLK